MCRFKYLSIIFQVNDPKVGSEPAGFNHQYEMVKRAERKRIHAEHTDPGLLLPPALFVGEAEWSSVLRLSSVFARWRRDVLADTMASSLMAKTPLSTISPMMISRSVQGKGVTRQRLAQKCAAASAPRETYLTWLWNGWCVERFEEQRRGWARPVPLARSRPMGRMPRRKGEE